jgi:hypothetical protein
MKLEGIMAKWKDALYSYRKKTPPGTSSGILSTSRPKQDRTCLRLSALPDLNHNSTGYSWTNLPVSGNWQLSNGCTIGAFKIPIKIPKSFIEFSPQQNSGFLIYKLKLSEVLMISIGMDRQIVLPILLVIY